MATPKRDEAILAEWKSKAWVSDDLKRELAVASGMRQLVWWRAAQRNTTEDEWAGLVGKFLVAVCPVLTNEADGVELFEAVAGEADGRQYRLDGSERRRPRPEGWALSRPPVRAETSENRNKTAPGAM